MYYYSMFFTLIPSELFHNGVLMCIYTTKILFLFIIYQREVDSRIEGTIFIAIQDHFLLWDIRNDVT